MKLVADFVQSYSQNAGLSVSFTASTDQVLGIFGPSGAGKTTLLRCIAGLEKPAKGKISYGDEVWFDSEKKINLPAHKRGVGFLFQNFALFPHLTVLENIRYGLRANPERSSRTQDIFERLKLGGLEQRRPSQLSGGQKQRVALARALVLRPKIVLLDEPLSTLDQPARLEMRAELKDVLKAARVPVLLVTHDRVEAEVLADELLLLNAGEIRQRGAPLDVFDHPVDLASARAVGIENFLKKHGQETLCFRAENVELKESGHSGKDQAELISLAPEGPFLRVRLKILGGDHQSITALIPKSANLPSKLHIGQTYSVFISDAMSL